MEEPKSPELLLKIKPPGKQRWLQFEKWCICLHFSGGQSDHTGRKWTNRQMGSVGQNISVQIHELVSKIGFQISKELNANFFLFNNYYMWETSDVHTCTRMRTRTLALQDKGRSGSPAVLLAHFIISSSVCSGWWWANILCTSTSLCKYAMCVAYLEPLGEFLICYL